MTTEVAIIKQENLQQIVQGAPQSYNDNRTSHDKCLAFAQQLMQAVQQNGGQLNDELDQRLASFIEKARRTVKAMNERRSPFTKLFDQVRTQFTQIENDIDPGKQGTIPYQLQGLRNQYAAKKLREQQEAQRKAMAEKQHKDALDRLATDIKNDFENKFQKLLDQSVKSLTTLDEHVTLDNYEESQGRIKTASTTLHDGFIQGLRFMGNLSSYPGVTPAEVQQKEAYAKEVLQPQFSQQFQYEMETNRDYILDRLPSKKKELEQIAAANKEEAARLQKEKEEREKAEKQRLEEERKEKQEEAEKAKQLEQQQKEMAGLFDGQTIVSAGTAHKAKVTKKIKLLDPEGILSIISMWWSKEGCQLSTEELAKKFKSQISFCEKIANKEGTLIQSEFVEYVDDVKVK